MIVAIDGPAGAGKSSVSRRLAERLGFAFLDTGAMYRCVTLYCQRNGIDLDDRAAVTNVARTINIRLTDDAVWIANDDVSSAIRTPEVTRAIKKVADNPTAREALVASQRLWASSRDVVTEGRDQGTVAFPQAECKIFLTATSEERARRRVAQLEQNGTAINYSDILAQQNQRDLEDTTREVGGLKRAPDAIEVWTDGLTEDEVLDKLVSIVKTAQSQLPQKSFRALGCEL
jgi:CMP/dCMP kinase